MAFKITLVGQNALLIFIYIYIYILYLCIYFYSYRGCPSPSTVSTRIVAFSVGIRAWEDNLPNSLHVYTIHWSIYIRWLHLCDIYIYTYLSYPRILHIESHRHVKQHLFLHPHGLILENAGLYMQQLWRQRWYSALLNPVVLSCFGGDQRVQGSSSGMRFFHDAPLTSL